MAFESGYRTPKKLLDDYKNLTRMLEERAVLNTQENKLSDKEYKEHIRKACLNFQFFVSTYFQHYVTKDGVEIPLAEFHISLAEKMAFQRRVKCSAKWARGMSKTTDMLFICCWMVFRRVHAHDAKINPFAVSNTVIVSASKDSAVQMLLNLRAEFESNAKLIEDCGTFKNKKTVWRNDSFQVKITPPANNSGKVIDMLFTAIGRDTSIKGLRHNADRVNLIILDDASDLELVQNAERAERTWENLVDNVFNTVDVAGDYRIAFVENAYHPQCLINKFDDDLKNYVKNGGNPKNVHFSKVNILTDKGKSAWPERFTMEDIIEKRRMNETTFLREYMQENVVSSRFFKPTHIQYTDAALFKYRKIISYYDPSISKDFKSIITVGLVDTTMQFHVLDVFCKQTTIENVIDYMFDLNLRFPQSTIYIESVFEQDATHWPILRAEMDKRRRVLPLIKDKHNKAKKEQRIEALLPFFSNIFFDIRLQDEKSFKNLCEQLYAFNPYGGNFHDDGPDAMQSAIQWLNNYRSYSYMNDRPVFGGNKKQNVW